MSKQKLDLISTSLQRTSTVPKDYNVVDGLLGLGQYILLETFSEMMNLDDLQQLLQTCKKTHNLKDHPRYHTILESFRLHAIESPCLLDLVIDGNTFTHTSENENYCTVQFDKLIDRGIVKVDILNIYNLVGVGITDESVRFDRNERPWAKGIQYITSIQQYIKMEQDHILHI
ncbi:MAG: hypothetical protein EZS28_023439 [Streblomastix strix]|uniref:Uncharacterized protein n=1 Tax=Streblomastix strix TaxID=222440 RepID=A0A5J4VEZ5_9EUKA|nr:MAG: hypothetical protein EZS28_023439 [Streblomastix strix]